MQHFTSLADVPNPPQLLEEAKQAFANPLKDLSLGSHKTLGLIFMNPSLRTRLSTEVAARNLGMRVIVLNLNQDSWQLEFEDGVVMDAGKAEHIREAAQVISQYVDIIGVRTFAGLQDRAKDYKEQLLEAFKQHAGVPVISLESATRHPLQSLADWLTISQHSSLNRPKVVLSWAPHPKALPQAVANSFLEWMRQAPVDLSITHPKGLELAEEFLGDTPIIYDQQAALEAADFVYVKNWSSFHDYGRVRYPHTDWMMTADKMAISPKAKFMHCLPIRRNVVATDEVLDGTQALIIPQAANRVPAAQAVLKMILQSTL